MIPFGTNLELKNVPRVTLSLIALNIMIFYAAETYLDEIDLGPLSVYLISFFSMFLHGNFYHLFGNMLFLWVFGRFLEDKIGSSRFLLYYFICEIGASLLHMVVDGQPAIGASGAISGVMGLYLYRCHYSKIKAIVPLLIFFFQVTINAKWLVLLWIIRDVYDALFTVDNVAHWAHIGGFLTGLVIGKMNNYWREATVEHLYDRAAECILTKRGFHDPEEDLLKVVKIDPYNAEANLELARYFSGLDAKEAMAKTYYLASARAYYLKGGNRAASGEVFLEYLNRYKETMPPVLHVKYAAALAEVGNYQGAAGILEPFIDADGIVEPLGEKIFINYIDFSLKANVKEPAEYAYEKFRQLYPDSLLHTKAESLIGSHKPRLRKKIEIERIPVGSRTEGALEEIRAIASDPVFKYILVVLFVALMIFGLLVDVDFLLPVPILLAFVMTYLLRKQASFAGSIFSGQNAPEDERVREYHISTFSDKARACEREERYDDAIEYLKAILEEDMSGENHAAVRYNIAQLYQKLNQPQQAIAEYKTVLRTAPQDHPLKRAAYDGIRELLAIEPSPAV